MFSAQLLAAARYTRPIPSTPHTKHDVLSPTGLADGGAQHIHTRPAACERPAGSPPPCSPVPGVSGKSGSSTIKVHSAAAAAKGIKLSTSDPLTSSKPLSASKRRQERKALRLTLFVPSPVLLHFILLLREAKGGSTVETRGAGLPYGAGQPLQGVSPLATYVCWVPPRCAAAPLVTAAPMPWPPATPRLAAGGQCSGGAVG